jgi:hypothetical protein
MIEGCPLPHDDVAYAILRGRDRPDKPPRTCRCGRRIRYAKDCVVVRLRELLEHRYGGPRSEIEDVEGMT